jgi:hypothetical protein
MAVEKEKIKGDIRELVTKTKGNENVEEAIEQFCEGLSELISEAILSLEVKAPSGSIAVSGSATSQTNINEIKFITK